MNDINNQQSILGRMAGAIFEKFYSAYIRQQFERARSRFFAIGRDAEIEYPWNKICGQEAISIGAGFHSNSGLFLGTYGPPQRDAKIQIGDRVVVNYNCQITAIARIEIGSDVLLGSQVLITDHYHGEISSMAIMRPPLERVLFSKGPVVIGDRVWIGSGVAILPGAAIGDDCIIGANAVVTRSFPPRSVIAGNPARLLKSL